MARVKRGTTKQKRRRNILRQVKGFRHGRGTKERQAHEAIAHAGSYALAHRRDKKNDFRKLWNIKINAATRPLGYSYSVFINLLKKKHVDLDRKVLADLAEHKPESFKRLVESLK